MNKFSKILTAGALVLSSISASASEITVGGVTWDPDYQTLLATDFIGAVEFAQWFSTAGLNSSGAPIITPAFPGTVGSMLQGVGEITRFNGKTDFVCTTCELTVTFGGMLFDNDLTDGSVYDLAASASTGFLNIYFDNTANFDLGGFASQVDSDAAADGSLFLSLGFDTLQQGPGYTAQVGHLDSFWSVSGGAAAEYFDTDSQLFGSDLGFAATVDFQNNLYGIGGGVASGNSIPEPTSLAIFGLGLLGLAGAAHRKA